MDKNENERFSLKLSNQIASIASGWKGTVFIDEYLKLKVTKAVGFDHNDDDIDKPISQIRKYHSPPNIEEGEAKTKI